MGKEIDIFVSPEVEIILEDSGYSKVYESYEIESYHNGWDEYGQGFIIEQDSSLNSNGVEIIIKPDRIESLAERVIKVLRDDLKLDEEEFTFDTSTGCHLNMSFWIKGNKEWAISRGWTIKSGRNITGIFPLSLMWEINVRATEWLTENGYKSIVDAFYRRYSSSRREFRCKKKETALTHFPVSHAQYTSKYYTWRVKSANGGGEYWEWRSFNLQGVETYADVHNVLSNIARIIREVVQKDRHEWKIAEVVEDASKKSEYSAEVSINNSLSLNLNIVRNYTSYSGYVQRHANYINYRHDADLVVGLNVR